MALDALRIFKKNNPEYTVYLYGSDLSRSSQPETYPEFTNLGLLTFSDSNKLYNVCELGICFSPTNPSNIPYEMMAAGLPCLDLDTKNKQDFPDNLLYLTVPNTFVIANKIEEILKDTDKLELASRAGLYFMKNRPLGLAFNQMRKAVVDILEGVKEVESKSKIDEEINPNTVECKHKSGYQYVNDIPYCIRCKGRIYEK
jgi:glycosyltransferase involved in cell wall biosynthesis